MIRPRFSIRTFLIAAVLIAFVGIPFGYRQYLQWRQPGAELIPVLYTDAETVADVLRAVYADPLDNGSSPAGQPAAGDPILIEVDARANALLVSAPQDVIESLRALVSAIDAPAITSNQVITLPIARPDATEESLRRVLDGTAP